jgi:hypothetical protein
MGNFGREVEIREREEGTGGKKWRQYVHNEKLGDQTTNYITQLDISM